MAVESIVIEPELTGQSSSTRDYYHPWVAQFVEAFFAALRDRNIKHCMLRNYQDFPVPRSATSDLDVMVDPLRWTEILDTLRQITECLGLRILTSFTSTTVTPLNVHIAALEGPSLHIDLLTGLVWRQYDLIDSRLLLDGIISEPAPPRPRPAHEAAVTLLGYLFHQGMVKPEYRVRISHLVAVDGPAFEQFIERVWGPERARELAGMVQRQAWDDIKSWKDRAGATLRRQGWMADPPKTMKRLAGRFSNTLSRLMWPPGVWIAVIGPDGCGKSTINAALMQSMTSIFAPNKSHHLHWRPGVLPAPGAIFSARKRGLVSGPVTDPHAPPPRSTIVSIARFLYFCVDFVLGANFRFRPLLGRNGLIVVDRYFYDFFVDQRRYRLKLPQWIVSAAERLIPRPNLIFYLDVPSEVILGRKAELPVAELDRQRASFVALVGKLGSRARLVDANRSVEEIANDLRMQVFDYLAAREQRRGILHAGRSCGYYPLSLILGTASTSGTSIGTDYLLLPSRRNARWLVPAHSAKLATTAMDFYAPAKWSGKAYKWLLQCWLKTRIGPHFFNRERFASNSRLLDVIRSVVPGGSVASVAISLGTAGPRQKLTLSLIDTRNQPVAFAKIAHRPHACKALHAERALLLALEQQREVNGQVPRSLKLCSIQGFLIHVQSPGFGRNGKAVLATMHWEFLQALADGKWRSLHDYLGDLGLRKDSVVECFSPLGGEGAALMARACVKILGEQDDRVATCYVHGDFASWNMRVETATGGAPRLFVYDWECGYEGGLPLQDAYHFVIQSAILVHAFDCDRILAGVREMLSGDECLRYREAMNVSIELAERLLVLYLVQTIRDAMQTGEPRDTLLQQRRIGVLRSLLR